MRPFKFLPPSVVQYASVASISAFRSPGLSLVHRRTQGQKTTGLGPWFPGWGQNPILKCLRRGAEAVTMFLSDLNRGAEGNNSAGVSPRGQGGHAHPNFLFPRGGRAEIQAWTVSGFLHQPRILPRVPSICCAPSAQARRLGTAGGDAAAQGPFVLSCFDPVWLPAI